MTVPEGRARDTAWNAVMATWCSPNKWTSKNHKDEFRKADAERSEDDERQVKQP